MINLKEEAIMFDILKKYITSYESCCYSFKNDDDKWEDFKHYLIAFRYFQHKLSDKTLKISLYPKQLVNLARYYYYSTEYGNKNAAKTRQLIIEWVQDFYNIIDKYNGNISRKNIVRMSNPAYNIPHFGNYIPLDSIISDAILAGEFDELEYPSPENLPLNNGRVFTFTSSNQKEETKRFWLTQLNSLIERENQVLAKREEEYKIQVDVMAKKQNNTPEYNKINKSKYRLLSRRVEAVFLLGVWFADTFQKQQNDIKDHSDKYKSSYFTCETDRLKRIFMHFNSDPSINETFEDFASFIVRMPSNGMNTIGFTYQPLDNSVNASNTNLPDLQYLDNGSHLRDMSLKFYYDISFDSLKYLIKIITPLESVIKLANCADSDFREDRNEPCYCFSYSNEIKNREDLIECLYTLLPSLSQYVAKRIITTKNYAIYRKSEDDKKDAQNENNKIVNKILRSEPLTNDEFQKIKNMLLKNIKNTDEINSVTFSNETLQAMEKITNKNNVYEFKNGELKSNFTTLLKKIYKNDSLFKTSTSSKKNIKKEKAKFKRLNSTKLKKSAKIFASLREETFDSIFALDEGKLLKSLAEISARMYTLILKMSDAYQEISHNQDTEKYIPWAIGKFLYITEGEHNEESNLINAITSTK